MSGNNTIILVSCGYFEKEIIEKIENEITKSFHIHVSIRICNLDISNFYNPGRRQYDANMILKVISEMAITGPVKIIGLLRVDLFIPILTYIFGQASLGGKVAIASLYRLRNELYGMDANTELLIERFSKVVIHELGHAFGLIHCLDPLCIMRSSTYVEDIDQKELEFCTSCRNELEVRSFQNLNPVD